MLKVPPGVATVPFSGAPVDVLELRTKPAAMAGAPPSWVIEPVIVPTRGAMVGSASSADPATTLTRVGDPKNPSVWVAAGSIRYRKYAPAATSTLKLPLASAVSPPTSTKSEVRNTATNAPGTAAWVTLSVTVP